MTQRYAVPEGMKKAAIAASEEYLRDNQSRDVHAEVIAEAVIQYQTENPIVPNRTQCVDLLKNAGLAEGEVGLAYMTAMLTAWQTMMYIAKPEPEAPQAMLYNEIEIGWRGGKVTAGPFIRENAVWTPEQAEQFAEYLKSSAQKAREQKPAEPEPSGPKPGDPLVDWECDCGLNPCPHVRQKVKPAPPAPSIISSKPSRSPDEIDKMCSDGLRGIIHRDAPEPSVPADVREVIRFYALPNEKRFHDAINEAFRRGQNSR